VYLYDLHSSLGGACALPTPNGFTAGNNRLQLHTSVMFRHMPLALDVPSFVNLKCMVKTAPACSRSPGRAETGSLCSCTSTLCAVHLRDSMAALALTVQGCRRHAEQVANSFPTFEPVNGSGLGWNCRHCQVIEWLRSRVTMDFHNSQVCASCRTSVWVSGHRQRQQQHICCSGPSAACTAHDCAADGHCTWVLNACHVRKFLLHVRYHTALLCPC